MAFEILANNGSGIAVMDAPPAGVIAGPDNFIDLYTYADHFRPDIKPQLYMRNGKGSITGLVRLLGNESVYASDNVKHHEEGRLMTVVKDVTVVGNVFTATTVHNCVVGQTVKISDGTTEKQAEVTAVGSPLVFTATPDDGVAYAFVGPVDVICDFSNSYDKGSDDADDGRRWAPDVIENFTQIIKKSYDVSASDMVHDCWVMTSAGPRWFNHEIERTGVLFENLIEATHVWHERKVAGSHRGMNALVPSIESRGNVANEIITSIDDLSDIAFRIKQQSNGCREFTIFGGHAQQAAFRVMCAGVNAHYLQGGNYGMFSNSMEMALKLDFKSIYIDGVTFHCTNWDALDDPSFMGLAKFRATGVACLIAPTGRKDVLENGNVVSTPYLSIRYRGDANLNRKREIKLFGPGGTPHKKDTKSVHYLSECTQQLAGANEFFVVRNALNAPYYS